jgi:flagellar basal body-associated protein FliL
MNRNKTLIVLMLSVIVMLACGGLTLAAATFLTV